MLGGLASAVVYSVKLLEKAKYNIYYVVTYGHRAFFGYNLMNLLPYILQIEFAKTKILKYIGGGFDIKLERLEFHLQDQCRYFFLKIPIFKLLAAGFHQRLIAASNV